MQFSPETPRVEFTVQNRTFSIPQPFTPGHVCSEGEASQLNQILVENVRNNFAGKIKAQAEKPENERKDFTQADLDTYVSEYEMGVRRPGSGEARLTPVEREARRIARDRIDAALKARNQKVEKEAKEELVRTLAARADIVKEAEKRVRAVEKISIEELGLGEEPTQEAA